jgi:hypothetical protein
MKPTWAVLLLWPLWQLGCYDPRLATPGYFCHATDVPACPDGQRCADGRCVSASAQAVPIDLGPQRLDANGMNDLSQASGADLSAPAVDLSLPAADLTSCVGKGGDCTYHKDSVCCSNYCVYSTNTCK